MPTRRDQLQAYRFQHQRALAALVTGHSNPVEPPMRRLTATTLSGIMMAILVAAGFAVLGVIDPRAGDAWKRPGAIIVERETGTRFVRIDDVLHPVLNYSSAVLAVGTNQAAKVVLVHRDELAGARRGATIGIDDIPDALPPAATLVTTPWTVCSQQRSTADPGRVDVRTSVAAGSAADARPVPAGGAVLVQAVSTSRLYLLFGGQRLAVGSGPVATAFGLQTPPLRVGTALLDAIPAGPALQAPDVPHAGRRSALTVAGRTPLVGQLLHVTDNDTYLVVLTDGVAALDPVQTALLRTLPIAAGRPAQPVETSESTALALPQSKADGPALVDRLAGLPERSPSVSGRARAAGAVCATYRPGQRRPTFTVPPGRRPGVESGPGTVHESFGSRHGLADTVAITPGAAALVRSGSGSSSAAFVLTDSGRRYRASREVLVAFGYGAATPNQLPARLLSTLPLGPALDPAAARRPPAD